MHWLRIERFWVGEYPDVRVRFLPVHLPALPRRPLRAGLPGLRQLSQPGRPERPGLQPLRRHPLLRQQLPLCRAGLQLLSITSGRNPLDNQLIPGRHRAQPRGDGEVHLLHPAHPPGQGGGQGGRTAGSATARCSRPAPRPARPRRWSSATWPTSAAGWRGCPAARDASSCWSTSARTHRSITSREEDASMSDAARSPTRAPPRVNDEMLSSMRPPTLALVRCWPSFSGWWWPGAWPPSPSR